MAELLAGRRRRAGRRVTLMTADRVTEVYEGTASSKNHSDVVRRRIHWMCSQAAGNRVLDVGCSQGITSVLLGREGREVVGVDCDLAALEFARDRLLEEEPPVQKRVEFVYAEAATLPFGDEAFDSAILGELLEHLVDPRRVLAEARRVLRPGGSVIITTPYGLHEYPDHKEPIYLAGLLPQVAREFSIVGVELIDRYIAIVGQARSRAGRVPARSLWSDALALAEQRLAEQDRTASEQHQKLKSLYAERRQRGDVEMLTAQKAAAEARVAALAEEVRSLKARIQMLEEAPSEAARQLAVQEKLVERLEEANQYAKGELQRTDAELAQARVDAETAAADLQALRTELEATQGQLAHRAEQLSNVLESRTYRVVRGMWRVRRLGRKTRPALPAGD